MERLNKLYPPRFFKSRHRLQWRAEPMCVAILDVLKVKRVIDVGCAVGELVDYFLRIGLDAWGLDGSPACKEFFLPPTDRLIIADLRKPLEWTHDRFDLAICLEVLEHIEEEYSDVVVQNLIALSDKLLISAAPPGQGGLHHVNCQPPEYWISKFSEAGFIYDDEILNRIRWNLEPWKRQKEMSAWYRNLMFFNRKESES